MAPSSDYDSRRDKIDRKSSVLAERMSSDLINFAAAIV